jgi:hypothetical protein
MSQNPPSDFVDVQLTAAGEKFAGEAGVLRFSNGRFSYTFTKGHPTRVVKAYEWSSVLSAMNYQGEPVFAIVPAAAPANTMTEVEHAD